VLLANPEIDRIDVLLRAEFQRKNVVRSNFFIGSLAAGFTEGKAAFIRVIAYCMMIEASTGPTLIRPSGSIRLLCDTWPLHAVLNPARSGATRLVINAEYKSRIRLARLVRGRSKCCESNDVLILKELLIGIGSRRYGCQYTLYLFIFGAYSRSQSLADAQRNSQVNCTICGAENETGSP
jgi:hypothetical protein